MNRTHIIAWLSGLWIFVTAIFVLLTLQQGFSIVRIMRMLLLLAPILMILFFSVRAVWPALVLTTMASFVDVPLPLLDRLSISFVMVAGVTVFVIARIAIDKNTRGIFGNTQGWMMFVAALIVMMRLIYDRPGSARIGGRGGLGEAVYYVLGVIGFFSMTYLARGNWDIKKNARWMFYMGIIVAVFYFIPRIHSEYGYARLFRRPIWLLLAIILAYTLNRFRNVSFLDFRKWTPYVLMGGILLLCAVQPHRRSVLMGLAMILSIAFVYRRFKRTAFFVLVGGGLALMLLIIFFPQGIPWSMKRALSVIVPITEDQALFLHRERGYSFEVGWASEFRTFMYQLAFQRIRSNPLFGMGFSYSVEEILHEFNSVSGKFGSRGIYALALAGGYHNSILSLAVFCGLPAAIMFCLSSVITTIRFLKVMLRRTQDRPEMRFMGAVFLGFLSPGIIIMLVNGMAYEFFMVGCVLGLMNGLTMRIESEARVKAAVAAPPARMRTAWARSSYWRPETAC